MRYNAPWGVYTANDIQEIGVYVVWIRYTGDASELMKTLLK